ncbi:PP2C family protein-serine/threonine phosphatase [Natronospora cellulosivora (SeqCode)]
MIINLSIFNIIFSSIIILVIILLLFLRYKIKENISLPVLLSASAQSPGARKEQEDSLSYIDDEDSLLAVLADGMGGLSSGKKASSFVVKFFIEEFAKKDISDSINNFLINTTYLSNSNLLKEAAGENIGTTLIAIFIKDDNLYWVSVGDSQIYLFRNNYVQEINPRHTYAMTLQEAYENGEISRETAKTHPKRNRLISYLGYKDFHLLDYSKTPIKLNKGDKIILCSDGIYNTLSSFELEEILKLRKLDPQSDVNLILETVLSKNIHKQDNASIMIIEKTK